MEGARDGNVLGCKVVEVAGLDQFCDVVGTGGFESCVPIGCGVGEGAGEEGVRVGAMRDVGW